MDNNQIEKICKNCKHWNRDKISTYIGTSWRITYTGIETAECTHLSSYDTDPMITSDYDGPTMDSGLSTRHDFGCNKFEPIN